MDADRAEPRRIGLTGGIAAGKSVVTGRLAELGAAVIDHDELARVVVRRGSETLERIVATFGPEVRTPEGDLDRAALARIVFTRPDARERLNAIVHPAVAHEAADREATALRGGYPVVVHDIPLLVETGQAARFDEVVVVSAPSALRVDRLVHGRGMSADEAHARLAAQTDDAARAAVAHVVLDGSGDVEDLRAQVDRLWQRWSGAN